MSEIQSLRPISTGFMFWCSAVMTIGFGFWPHKTNGKVGLSGNPKLIHIAVIDTGINFSRGRLSRVQGESWDCRSGRLRSVDSSESNRADPHGHGTHVAGLIQMAFERAVSGLPLAEQPLLKISSYRYYPEWARGSILGVNTLEASNCALRSALDHSVDMINYSGGGPQSSDVERGLVERAMRQGVPIIAAAGNSGADLGRDRFYPASYVEFGVIGVAAVDSNWHLFSKSNHGTEAVSVAAEGVEVLSNHSLSEKLVPMTGTSQATAIASGAIAAVLGSQGLLSASHPARLAGRSSAPFDLLALIEEFSVPQDHLIRSVKSGLTLNPSWIARQFQLKRVQYSLTVPAPKVTIRPVLGQDSSG